MQTLGHRFHILYSLFFCLLITAALLIQFVYGALVSGGFTIGYVVLYISYFTIVSNVLVAIVLGLEAYKGIRGQAHSVGFDRFRGATVFCILTTGVTYTLFLRGPGMQGAVQDAIPWINAVFHYIMPSVMMLEWIIYPPMSKIPWNSILKWIGLAVVYLIYVEILGFFSHVYPYFFVSPVFLHGYLGVARASLGWIPFFIVFGVVLVGINRLRLWSMAVSKK